MNFLRITDGIATRISKAFHIAVFLLIKKSLYTLSYNSNGNRFVCKGIMTRCSVKVFGGGNELIINKGVRLNNVKIVISGHNNRLVLHEGVRFHESGRIRIEDENNLIEIGERTNFVDCFFAVSDCDSKVVIGTDCMFSAKIIIRNSDTHSILNDKNIRINPARDVFIGDRVWVAYGATILKGTLIEDDSIVGTETVVAGTHIPKASVAAGNPAKVMKDGVHWCRERLK